MTSTRITPNAEAASRSPARGRPSVTPPAASRVPRRARVERRDEVTLERGERVPLLVALPPARAHLAKPVRVREQRRETVRQGLRIAWRHESPRRSVLDDLGERALVGRDDREPGPHRLERD